MRKKYFQQHKERHKNAKEAYTDRSKSMGRKVGFAVVFTDITKRRTLPEEASIHTAKITAIKVTLKEKHKRENKRWAIYTDSQSSMQSIKYNKDNCLILSKVYGILAELQAQDKKITLCKKICTHGN